MEPQDPEQPPQTPTSEGEPTPTGQDESPSSEQASPPPSEAGASPRPSEADAPREPEPASSDPAAPAEGAPAAEAAPHADELSHEAAPPEVTGTIQVLGDEEAEVALEDGRIARCRKLELADAVGKIHAQVGDKVSGVLHEEDGVLRLVRRRSPRAAALEQVADAFLNKTPVDGRVVHAIKGGFEVRIFAVRAFCPSSQLSIRRDDITGDPVGQTLQFVVTKFDPEGKSLVVSRRKLLERDHKRQAAGTREMIKPGARLKARVVSVQPYGAFMDLGGMQGLLHVSEMSHGRVGNPNEIMKVGDEMEVVVLKHDEGFKKISLSRRALETDPWADVRLAQGQVHRAIVRRILGFGAFLEISPGVEGLLARGELQEGEVPGSELLVQITELDAHRHRLALARAPEGKQAGDVVDPPVVEVGARIDGTVERVVPFGVFVRLLPRRTGLLHASETGTPQGTDLAQAFPPGSRVSVEILEIAEDGQRIRLTRRTTIERAAAEAQRAAARAPRPPMGMGMGDTGEAPRGESRDRRPRSEPRRDGPGGFPRQRDRGGERGGDRHERGDGGGERRGGRDRGQRESLHNPAAAPRTGFASFGDALRQKLGLPEPAPPPKPATAPRERVEPPPSEPAPEAPMTEAPVPEAPTATAPADAPEAPPAPQAGGDAAQGTD